MKVVTEVSRRSTVSKSSKKGGTVVSRRKERTRVVCERKSPEGQNRAARGSVEGRAKMFAEGSDASRK